MAEPEGPEQRWRWRCGSCGMKSTWYDWETNARASSEIHAREICEEAALGRSAVEIEVWYNRPYWSIFGEDGIWHWCPDGAARKTACGKMETQPGDDLPGGRLTPPPEEVEKCRNCLAMYVADRLIGA